MRSEQSGDCPATKWAGRERPVPMALTARNGPGTRTVGQAADRAGGRQAVGRVAPGTVTVYPVIGEPPSDFGGDQEIVPPPSTGPATAALGGPGGRIPGLPAPAGVVTAKVSDEIARTAGPHRRTVGFRSHPVHDPGDNFLPVPSRQRPRSLDVPLIMFNPIPRGVNGLRRPIARRHGAIPVAIRLPDEGNRAGPDPSGDGGRRTVTDTGVAVPGQLQPPEDHGGDSQDERAEGGPPGSRGARRRRSTAAHQASDQWGDRRATRSSRRTSTLAANR